MLTPAASLRRARYPRYVDRTLIAVPDSTYFFSQLVLIEPRLAYDPFSEHGGLLIVTVPKGNDFATFSLPIEPTPDILDQWTLYVRRPERSLAAR